MTYIGVPTVTDPDTIALDAITYLETAIPGWVPADGNLEIWMIMALAQMLATSRDVASIVPDEIFEYFGTSIMNIPPIGSAPASVLATVVVQDTLGYTIPAGTQVGFQATGNTVVLFTFVNDTIVIPGSSTVTAVPLQAETPGSAADGFTGTMVVVDPLAFIVSVTATSTSSGGVDAEDATTYLNRLRSDLQLLSPRPILANDFAVLAQSVAGVFRAIAIDQYNAPRTFTDGAITTPLNTIRSAAQAKFVQADIGRVISDTGGHIPGGTTISSVTDGNTAIMSANGTTTAGDTVTLAALSGQARTVAVSAVDATGTVVSGTIQTAILAYLNSLREANFVVSFAQPTVTTINVVYTIHCTTGSNTAAIVAAVTSVVQAYLSKANWGGGNLIPPQWSPTSGVVRYLQVAGIIENVPGVAYVASLTLNGSAADVTISGVAPLADVGTVSGTAV